MVIYFSSKEELIRSLKACCKHSIQVYFVLYTCVCTQSSIKTPSDVPQLRPKLLSTKRATHGMTGSQACRGQDLKSSRCSPSSPEGVLCHNGKENKLRSTRAEFLETSGFALPFPSSLYSPPYNKINLCVTIKLSLELF